MSPRLRIGLLSLGGFASIIAFMRLTAPKPPSVPLGDRRVDSAATWHLKGWRLLEKKQIPWEIWGQAKPLFLYERIGNSVRIATQNREDVSLEPWRGKAPLTVLGSELTAKNQLVLLQEWSLPERDPTTNLPTGYRIQTGGAPLAELSATYNQPLPTEGLELVRQGTVIDTQQSLPSRLLPPNTTYRGGVTVHATVVASDPEGNLKVAVDVTPGPPGAPESLPLTAYCRVSNMLQSPLARRQRVMTAPPPTAAMVDMSRLTPIDGPRQTMSWIKEQAPRDDQGVVYRCTDPAASYRLHSHSELYLARITPLAPGAKRPKTVTLDVLTELGWANEARQLFKLADVKKDLISVTVPLPAPVRALPAPPPPPSPPPTGAGPATGYTPPIPFTMAIALARFRHYRDLREGAATTDPEKQKAYADKALQYFNQAMALCPPNLRKDYEYERKRLTVVGKPAE
ncbi:hypothetical protein [Armatimonas rosea]|uniref:Uncharacterized protein n=1 Tax=Armatimonas rosea TaxID=685828 RepID=A0A7W9SV19_ARMRO|nr:hypothetical protein [Armatimonas rosea]MBB6053375.1 hypothetical protein [Armatimonas rosea]